MAKTSCIAVSNGDAVSYGLASYAVINYCRQQRIFSLARCRFFSGPLPEGPAHCPQPPAHSRQVAPLGQA